MKHKRSWWKLDLFVALAIVGLWWIPASDIALFILWLLFVYGVILVWVMSNELSQDEDQGAM